jgi:hypothetical protein
MNFWLICLPRVDLQHCIKVGTFGLSRKNVIKNVKTGDKLVCCAGKGDWKIIALGVATSDYFLDDEQIFLKNGFFVDRFHFRAQNFPSELDLMSVIDRLSFVTNPSFWAVYFRNGIAKLSEKDWQLISGRLSANDLNA